FHVRFLIGGRTLEAAVLARTLTVRPESTTITYAGDDFSVRETLFVPVNEPGAVITFAVQTAQPLEIKAAFERDFQLEWPAALGGTYLSWDWQALYSQSAEFYRASLARTVQIKIPDQQLQQAYDWARVSMVQGLVTNPWLGTGLIAGYRTSGEGQRPGFAWYFGRDSLW